VSNAKIDFDNITCPSCGTVIPISETIHHRIAELTRQELASETSHARKALAEKEEELKRRELSLTKTVQEKVAAVQADLSVAIATKLRAELSTEIADLICSLSGCTCSADLLAAKPGSI